MKRTIFSLAALVGILGGVVAQAHLASPAHAGYWEYQVASTGEIFTTDFDPSLIDGSTDSPEPASETRTMGWFRYATTNP